MYVKHQAGGVDTSNLSELIAKVETIVENAQNLNVFATPVGALPSKTIDNIINELLDRVIVLIA